MRSMCSYDIPPEQLNIGALICRINCIARRARRGNVKNKDVNQAYRRLHMELIQGDGCSQKTLAEKTGLSAPTVSVVLGKMERDGLVYRKTDLTDTRRSCVHLTEKGMEIDRAMQENVKRHEERINAALTEEERAQLKVLLAKLCAALEEEKEIESESQK